MSDKQIDLSIIIIALNEEENLKRCLQSLPEGCEIIVVDSGSKDKTVDVAANYGAVVKYRPFDNYANQKNFALSCATRGWVFSLDADEVLNANLSKNIVKLLKQGQAEKPRAYKVTRKLVFMGKVMNFGKTRDFPIRIFRRGFGEFEGDIHEKLVLKDGFVGQVSGFLLHFSYKNLDDYFERFNLYTSKIALFRYKQGKTDLSMFAHLLRPWFEFFSRYIFRLGFLDGRAGYTYALVSSLYAYVKYEKFLELRTQKQGIK